MYLNSRQYKIICICGFTLFWYKIICICGFTLFWLFCLRCFHSWIWFNW